jgi:hypothetical protein
MELTREEIAWLVAVCPRSLEVWAGKNGIACVGICPFPFATVATINPDKDVDFAKLFATAPALAALALALMDERDRYREALELIDRTTRDYGIGIGATCNNTAHYALEPVQKEAAHAEADQ